MPITATLQNMDGTLPIGTVVDAYGGLNSCLPFGSPDAEQSNLETFPLLKHVDAYCDVMFTQARMPQLLDELDRVANGTSDEESRRLMKKVRKLAVKCRDTDGLCLCFFGD